jgi:signal transduction histidine kinase
MQLEETDMTGAISEQRMASNPSTESQLKILIVDDEFGPRESLRLILTPKYDVVIAQNGQEALETFAAEAPDMVISDIRMPQMNGVDLMKAVKKLSPDTPFILVTGFGTLESAQEAVRAGAVDYISKPYNVKAIRQVVDGAFAKLATNRDMENTITRLRESSQQIEQSVLELDQKASIGDLSADMIHDLNNPICVLRCNLEFLEDSLAQHSDFEQSEEKELLEVLKRQTDRCIEMTRNFLDYARPSGRTWNQDNVNAILKNTLFVFRVRFRSTKIDLQTDFSETLPSTWVQSTPLQQVFYNLVSNAVEAMEETGLRGTLRITTRHANAEETLETSDSAILISIEDSGPGMTEDVQQKVFERFFTTKSKGKGTGLGLPLCKRIVNEHGGSISLQSEEGRGTTFTILLPVRETPPQL